MFFTVFTQFVLSFFIILLFLKIGKPKQSFIQRFVVNNFVLFGILVFQFIFIGIILISDPSLAYIYAEQAMPFEIGNYLIILPLFVLLGFYSLYSNRKSKSLLATALFSVVVLVESQIAALFMTTFVMLFPETYIIMEGLMITILATLITHIIWLSKRDKKEKNT